VRRPVTRSDALMLVGAASKRYATDNYENHTDTG
jgi:hypothetical protein